MNIKLILLQALGLFCVLSLTQAKSQPLQKRELVCCATNFTLENVLASARLPKAQKGKVHFLICRSKAELTHTRYSSADPPLNYFRQLFLSEFETMPGTAYVIQSSRGAAAALWNPQTGKHEAQTIWGEDILHPEDGSEIIGVDFGRKPGWATDFSVIRVFVWAKSGMQKGSVLKTIHSLRKTLGVSSLQVVVGTTPYLWEADGFPLMVPAFGARGLRESKMHSSRDFTTALQKIPRRNHCASWTGGAKGKATVSGYRVRNWNLRLRH